MNDNTPDTEGPPGLQTRLSSQLEQSVASPETPLSSSDESAWLAGVRADLQPRFLGRIGPYELLEKVGQGGQGVVFKARQPGTARLIAIKRLSAGAFATPEMRVRFEREVEAAVALDHPNVVTVFGTELVDDQPVLAMKWIDGVPIDRWACAQGDERRPVREVLEVFALVCDAVQHAHQRGVIHRDLKPSNILVDADNRPFVLDFGLAKLKGNSSAAAPVTVTGQFLGTPAYAAPEQLRGDQRGIDVRTDVYALGAILYRLLTGEAAFPDTGDIPALIFQALHRDPPAPSSRDRRLNRELDAIILKALAKGKEERYASVDALGNDLRRFLDGEAVLAHPPSTVYQISKFVRQHRGAVAGVGAFAVLLLTATVLSTVLYVRGEKERRRADAALVAERVQLAEARKQQDRAEKEAQKASEANRFVNDMLARADRGAQKGNPNVTVREALDTAAADLQSGKVSYDPEVEASVRNTIGKTYDALGLAAMAEPHHLRALELLKSVHGETDLHVAESMHNLGSHYRGQSRFADADNMLQGALRIRRTLLTNPNDPILAENLVSLGIVKRQQGKYDETERCYLAALEIYRNAYGPDDDEVTRTLQNLGVLYLFRNRFDDAERVLRDLLAVVERKPIELDGPIAGIKENLAMAIFRRHGNRDPDGEAESLLRAVIDLKIKLNGADHPSLTYPQTNLAQLLVAEGRLDEAAVYARDSVSTANTERLSSNVNGFVKIVHNGLGRPVEAEAALRETLENRLPFLGPTHPAIGHIQLNIGLVLTAQGKFAEAEPLLLAAEEILAASPDFEFANARNARGHLSKLYEQWNAADPAEDRAAKAAAWRKRTEAVGPETSSSQPKQ